MSAIEDYWAALERLKSNAPLRLPVGSKINKDTVALEAGRKRTAIKKSRKPFSDLIVAIENAARQSVPAIDKMKLRAEKNAIQAQDYKGLLHESLNRELMSRHEIVRLKKKLRAIEPE